MKLSHVGAGSIAREREAGAGGGDRAAVCAFLSDDSERANTGVSYEGTQTNISAL